MTSGVVAAESRDVVVMGGGVAGLAAATLLARSGLRVTCVEPDALPRTRVGESLDWSAPSLLRRLGYRREELIADCLGTYKCDIEVFSPGRTPLTAHPPRILSRRPLGAEMTTVHLDRERFDASLFEHAERSGVEFVWDAVVHVEMDGDRVAGCATRGGRRLSGDWYIDASGPSRPIGRASDVGIREYAIPRVCLWTEAALPRSREGTTLSLDTNKQQLEWAWEIPLGEGRQSLGLVMPSRAFRDLERRGRSKARVLVEQLARFPRYADLDAGRMGEVRARSYRPYVSRRVVGSNWMMAGEAAVLIDPLTSIGVTAALRNAAEAATIIADAIHGRLAVDGALADYDRRVRLIGDTYNSAIEALIYRPQVRDAFGLRGAGLAYVLLGYGMNTMYTRLRPTTRRKTYALAALAAGGRSWTRAWLLAAVWHRRMQGRDALTPSVADSPTERPTTAPPLPPPRGIARH